MKKTLNITFGLLADPLRKQLRKARITRFSTVRLKHLQRDCDAVNRLYVRGVLTESEKDRVRRKIMKNLITMLEEYSYVGEK